MILTLEAALRTCDARSYRSKARTRGRGEIGLLVAFLAYSGPGCQADERPLSTDDELYDTVQTMIGDVARLSGLAVMREVRVARETPEQVRAYVQAQLAQEYPSGTLEGVATSYRLLGLLPQDLELRTLLLELYAEQIVGYYDPEREALFVVEGAGLSEFRPVLAHELVHALQDQHADLDSLIAPARGNDRQMAAQAALEGHATLVMFSLLAEEAMGAPVDPLALPNPGAQLRAALEVPNAEFPVFGSAPRILRESLLFPYASGAEFVQSVWTRAGGVVAPLDSLVPQSTEQVLDPDSRFLAARDEPEEVRFDALEGSTVQYENTLGQFETGVFLSVHLGEGSDRLAAGWDGDRYIVVQSVSGPSLIWQSVWDDEASASRFAQALAGVVGSAESGAALRGVVERRAVAGRPGVLAVIAASDDALRLAPRPDAHLLSR